MLYIIGLGLGDERDITLRGLEAVKKSQKIYMEAYTSLLSFGLSSDGLSNLVSLSKPSVDSSLVRILKSYVFSDRKSFMGNRSHLLIERWWKRRQGV